MKFFSVAVVSSLLAAKSLATPVQGAAGTGEQGHSYPLRPIEDESANGVATLGDLTVNDCNLQLPEGSLAFLVSPNSDFVKAK